MTDAVQREFLFEQDIDVLSPTELHEKLLEESIFLAYPLDAHTH